MTALCEGLQLLKLYLFRSLSHKGMKIHFKNILECRAVGKEKRN